MTTPKRNEENPMTMVTGNMPLGWKGEWLAVHIPGFHKIVGIDSEGIWFEFILPDDLYEKGQTGTEPTQAEQEAFYNGAGEDLYIRQFPTGTHTPGPRDTLLGVVGGIDYYRWVPDADFRLALQELPRMDSNQEGYGVVGPDGKIDPLGAPDTAATEDGNVGG